MSYNYPRLRARFKPPEKRRIPSHGRWVTVAEASALTGLSKQAIRLYAMTGRVQAIRVPGFPLLVDLNNFEI